jgi:exodeoxyribonuclease VII large subunit
VQGSEAPPAIVKALQALPALAPVEVILLSRGGGSLEDLWAFNDEAVVRAVRACIQPVVSGVGHEIDFTLTDFAADLRAPTPTAAAEQVSPDLAEQREALEQTGAALLGELRDTLRQHRQHLAQQGSRLQALHPGRRLQQRAQQLDELGERLLHASPLRRIELQRQRVALLADRLRLTQQRRHERAAALLARQATALAAYNPTAVLERGYAIAFTPGGQAARDAAQLPPGTAFTLRLARGSVQATTDHS